jgi:5-(aminomethyl)-3-furanmethanol phosphate kinase
MGGAGSGDRVAARRHAIICALMPRVRPDAVLKVGGSLWRRPSRIKRLMAALATLAPPHTLVVVPGGGTFADHVRRADRRFALDPSSSHWMAILAMDQSAYLLRHFAPRALLIRNPEEIAIGRLNVLAPSGWLLRADPLPHSWGVTSDSIAAWVARALRAPLLILLKSVDGVPGASLARGGSARIRARATGQQLGEIVDAHFARALSAPLLSCWIVNGARPERIATLLTTGRTYGTEVMSRVRGPRRPPRGRAEKRRAPRHARD